MHTTDLCCDSKHVCTSFVVCIFKTDEILHVQVCFAAINACFVLFWFVLVNGLLTSFDNSVAQLSSRDLIVCVVCLILVVLCLCV